MIGTGSALPAVTRSIISFISAGVPVTEPMIFFLIVVTVGGTSGIIGPFLASLLLGIADVAGKYYLSAAMGGFVIYVVLIIVLVLRPQGLFARAR